MNNQQDSETSFERRLRADLESVVAERGEEQATRTAGQEISARPAWRRSGVRIGLAGTAVASVAAAALIFSAGGGETPSAFAVEPEPEGKISVEVNSLEDPKGLERELEAVGIPASVTYLKSGMACREPRFQPASSVEGERGALISGPIGDEGPLRFTISRDEVGPGQTLVVTARPGPGVLLLGGAEVEIAEGAVAPCEPIEG